VEIYSSGQSTITIVPLLHGKISFSERIRELCLAQAYDCIAVDLPAPFEPMLAEGIDDLPVISALIAEERAAHGPLFLVPIDPCDGAIEAVRQARHNHIHFSCIGLPRVRAPGALPALPDEYAIKTIGFEAYASLCLHAIGNLSPGSPEDEEARYIAFSLHRLRLTYSNILAVVHMRHVARTVFHFNREETHNLSFTHLPEYSIRRELADPDLLYFVLGELPFVTGKYEKSRYQAFSGPIDIVECVKDLFRETRDEYNESQQEAISLSPARIQRGLQFVRNLTLLDDRFIPELFDIITAAKGIGGNSYALHILKCARYYPYLPADLGAPLFSPGIDKIVLPGERQPRDAVNLFKDFRFIWKNLSLKPEPTPGQKRNYRFFWDPRGMCSHMPEDKRIENFNTGLREKAKTAGREDLIVSEKFTSSIRDGIDLRETLSKWHTGDIYVKNLPPTQGAVDTVVIMFDANHDERYPHLATWYAEHREESTLTFFSTDPFDNMIGPGIARSYYGGLSLLFPPRPVPNIFEMDISYDGPLDLAGRLTFGALLFSGERRVGFVSQKKPSARLMKMASHFKKRLVWIPMSSYSAETLKKLRMFHVLNGKEVRSWAGRFIGE
jgi:hypothetical protein